MDNETITLEELIVKDKSLEEKWSLSNRPYSFNVNPIIDRQKLYESNARSYPRVFEIAIAKAEGLYMEDTNGNVFIDCLSGAGSLALGHNHMVVVDAIEKCIADKIPLLTLDITTPIKDAFVSKLFSLLPEKMRETSKIQFCSPSGADAIEAAVKLVKTATGRQGMFSFVGAYHGMTHGALALMGNKGPKKAIGNLMKDVTFLPFPYNYRCPFGIGGKEADDVSLHYIKNILQDTHSGVDLPAAFILEAIQGEGGSIPASDYWLRGIRSLTEEYGIPLIIDEVQSGIGRTGDVFSFESSGITPDVIVISKAIGGSLPLSLIVYNEKLDVWSPGAHAGTFRGNQMAMATGLSVLNYITEKEVLKNVRQKSAYFFEEFKRMQFDHPFIGDVRGRGLMIGLEIVDVSVEANKIGSYPPNSSLAKQIQAECFKNGLIIETGGRNDCVLRFLPPLIINHKQAQEVVNILESAIITVSKK